MISETYSFSGKTAWVTGASSGLGAAMARDLAGRGARVILSGRDEAALEKTAADCPDHLVLPFEARDFDAIEGIAAKAWDWAGGVDILVNNAGVSQRALAVDTPFSVYRDLIEIDLLAPIALSQALLPPMAERGSGRFINIASIAGKVGSPLRTGYSAAKHGIVGYGDALRAETDMLGLGVHTVVLGSVATNVSRNALDETGKARERSDALIDAGMPASDASRLILDAMAEGQREIVVGRGIEVQLGEARRTPDELFDSVAAMSRENLAQQLETDPAAS